MLLAVPPTAHADELVTLPGGATANLPPQPAASVTFPVQLAANVKGVPSVKTVRLRRDSVDMSATSVRAMYDAAIPAIVLTIVREPDLARASAYEVTVRLTLDTRAQLVTLTLTRPAATLTVPTKVSVLRTQWFPELPKLRGEPSWLHDVTEKTPVLTVKPGRDSRIDAITTRQVETAEGRVTVTQPSSIAPGTPADLTYDLQGDFPLGTVTRTVEIDAPQLATPLTVQFEITTRRDKALIWVLILLGILSGLATRGLGPKLWGIARTRRRANTLRARLVALRAEYPDATFVDEIVKADALLADRTLRPTKLVNLIEQATTTAETAFADLQSRLAMEQTRYETLTALLLRDWWLPPVLREPLFALRHVLTSVDRALDRHDAVDAKTILDTGVATAVEGLVLKADEWAGTYAAALGQLQTALGTRTKGTLGAAAQAVAFATKHLPSAPADGAPAPASGSAATAELRLRQVDRANRTFESVPGAVAEVADELTRIAKVLDDVGATTRAAEVRSAAAVLRTAAVPAPDPAVIARKAATAIPTAIETTKGAVRGLLGSATDPDVEQRLTSGDLLGAAAVAAAKQPKGGEAAARAAATLLGSEDGTVPVVAAATAVAGAPGEPGAVVLPHRSGPGGVLLGAAGQVFAYSAGALLTVVQLIVLLVLVGLVGYPLFSANWVGTLADMTKVLSWAFAADITVAGVKKLMQPSTP
ncbi:MAG TPA: hypothetical protein VNA20_05525 [Frankiaceae bacterium]|nr:hypothetical protein [Frankiaceae bacterium]